MQKRTRNLIAVLLVVLYAAGAVLVLASYDETTEPELPPEAQAALSAVRARLMGGESARFRRIRSVSGSLWCGEVASPNAAKEYTGWHRWSVVDGRAAIEPDSLPDECR